MEIADFEIIGLNGFSLNPLNLLESRLLRGREGSSLLVHALSHSCFLTSLFIHFVFLHFLSYSYIPSLLLYFSFLLFSLCCFSLYTAKAFLYCPPWRVLLFYPSTTFGLVWVPFRDGTGLSTTQPSPLPCVGRATFYIQTKEFCFVFLLSVASHSDKGWVFSLTNSYGMHLVISAHFSLFWVVCHPSRTFPLKELEWES